MHLRALLVLACVASLAVASSAGAAVFNVSPGPGTPLQDAIDAASPGDTIRLANGVFHEAIVINKRLRISGRIRKKTPLAEINADCLAATAIDVAADDVNLSTLAVDGGTFSAVQILGRDRVKIKKVIPIAFGAGSGGGCGTERYGFEIGESSRVTLRDGSVYGTNFGLPGSLGFLGAAIYIHGVAPRAHVEIVKYFLDGHVNGVILQDSTGPSAVTLNHVFVLASDTGVQLINSDGVRFASGFVRGDGNGSPAFGIKVDATSDDNELVQNQVTGYAADVSDAGTSNCWHGTTFVTGSVPSDGCP
jgi:nitrous oxidase accessory protein NosD